MIKELTVSGVFSAAILLLGSGTTYGNEVTRFVEALHRGDALELRELESDVTMYLDSLSATADETRASEVLRLVDVLADPENPLPRGGPGEQSLARVLCRMEVYSLPDAESLSRLQSELVDRFELQWSIYTATPRESDDAYEAARFLDCAAFNAEGSYFDAVNSVLRVSPSGSCANRVYLPTSEIESLSQVMRDVGLQSARAESSYYWIRTALLKANVDVALTLAQARDPDIGLRFDGVRDGFARAGLRLGRLLDGDRLLTARNGWRWYNDVIYHTALYSLIGGAEPATQIGLLEQLASRPPVGVDPAFVDTIEHWVLDRIRGSDPDYVDPILVDRLFPGLMADPAADCSRNRRQSIETEDLANGTLACWRDTGSELASLEDLREFDLCLNQIESEVWWIQLGAYRNERRANDAAVRFRNDLTDTTDVVFATEVVGPDTTSSFYRLRTEPTLTRREAGLLSQAAQENGWETLIGRKPIW